MPNFLAQGVAPPDIAGQQRNALAMGMELENQNMRRTQFQDQRMETAKQRIRDDLTGVYASALLAPKDQAGAVYAQSAAEFKRRYPQLAQMVPDQVTDPRQLLTGLAQANPDIARKMVESRMPKPQEPYTLSPGSQRRGANNELLAEAPRPPDTSLPIEEVGVGNGMFQKVRVMPDGTTKPLGQPYQKAADASVDLKRTLADQKRAQDEQRISDSVAYTSDLIDQLIGTVDGSQGPHPGLSTAVGAKGPTALLNFGDPVPGTDAANFNSLFNQIKGRQFLEAFQSLRGGGQITQIEGEKATQAISRMNLAQSEDEFIRAAREFQEVINAVKERRAAGQNIASDPSMPAASAGPGGFRVIRRK